MKTPRLTFYAKFLTLVDMVTVLMITFLNLIPAKTAVKDSVSLFFIYGSSPAKGFEKTERKWFGGIHGGHVAMEIAPNSLLSFRSTEYPCQ
jgi:hypothetical protein